MQHVVDGDDVEGVGLEGQGIHVGLADLGIVDAGARQVGAGQRQHLAALVDADRALDLGRQHFEQPAGSGADVEQPPRAQRQVMGQRPLDLAVGDVQRPQLVPSLGVVRKNLTAAVCRRCCNASSRARSVASPGCLVSSRRTNSRTNAASSPPVTSLKRVNCASR